MSERKCAKCRKRGPFIDMYGHAARPYVNFFRDDHKLDALALWPERNPIVGVVCAHCSAMYKFGDLRLVGEIGD